MAITELGEELHQQVSIAIGFPFCLSGFGGGVIRMNASLRQYLVAVAHPDVSAFEHLEMLMIRDRLADQEFSLTKQERASLEDADQRLLRSAAAFYAELARITSLEEERRQRHPAPDRWWWYLDVLSALPTPITSSPILVPA